MAKPKKTSDAVSEPIPCVCEKPNCDLELIMTKYPGKKIKIRMFNKKNVESVVVLKKELMKKLRELR